MRKRFLPPIVLLCWLTACNIAPVEEPTQPVIDTPTPTQSTTPVAPTVTLTSTPTMPAFTATETATVTLVPPTVTATAATLKPITPEVIRICPEKPEVPLEELGLDPNEFLVVELYDEVTGRKLSPSETGAFVVTFDNPIPQPVPDTAARDGLHLVRYYPASDRQSIVLVYEDPEQRHRQVWRSTWDGQRQWKVEEYELEPLPANQSRRELGEDKYLIYEWTPDDPSRGIYSRPLSFHDRRTGETWSLPTFPEKTIILKSLIMDGVPYLVYLEEKRESLSEPATYDFTLYNLVTLDAMPAFQWLSGKRWAYWLTVHLDYLGDEYFTMFVTRSYGLDLGIDLDLETVLAPKTYEEVMQAIYLPGGEFSVNLFQGGYLRSRNGMVLIPQPMENIPISFYFLGFQDLTLRDYCYTVEDHRSTLLYTSFRTSVSERFVIFTDTQFGSADNPGGQFIKAVEILDLDTGHFASISDAQFNVIGWGIK